jgi:DUF218 domain
LFLFSAEWVPTLWREGITVWKSNRAKPLIVLGALILLGALVALRSGKFLVVDYPERSDVIVVLAGDHDDRRYSRGMELMCAGYGRQMLLDVPAGELYGHSYAEYATDFVARSAGDMKSQIRICVIQNDSTVQEAPDIARCLAQIHPEVRSVLVVTSDFHTRRARWILRSRLPQYSWSVAAVRDPSIFGESWWRRREWAKTCVYEWERLAWWSLSESWRR